MRLSAKVAAIELDGDVVRIALVKTGGRAPTLLEAHVCRASYSAPEERANALAQAVRTAVERMAARPAAYVLCVTSQFAVARALRLPFRGRRRVAAAMPFELEPYLAFPIEDLIVDFIPVRENEGQTEVLAVGVQRALLAEQVAVLTAAGIDPEGIDLDVAGLTALWCAMRRGTAALAAALHVREHGAILAVTKGKTLAFFRHLPVTVAQMREDASAAAREVQNSLRAFLSTWKTEDTLEELVVTGVTLSEEERISFEEGVTGAVRYENLLDRVKKAHETVAAADPDGPTATEGANCWEPLVGVALAAAGGGQAFNFRQGNLAPSRDVLLMEARRLILSGALAAALLLCYALYCCVGYRKNALETARIGDTIWEVYAAAFPESAQVKQGRPAGDVDGAKSADMMAEEIGRLDLKSRALTAELLNRPTVLDILAEIAARMPNNKVTITDVIIRAGDTASQPITIIGEETNSAAFQEAFQNLKASTLLRVDDEPMRRSQGAKTSFTITGKT